jgi:hypothetical protein
LITAPLDWPSCHNKFFKVESPRATTPIAALKMFFQLTI